MNKQIQNIREKIIRHKTLVSNFGYLSALQVFTMLVPLITLPYLIKVLGTETYGLVVFAQAIIAYLVILVNFGFNISATKEVSIHRDNKEKLSEIVSSVLIIKGILFAFTMLVLAIVLYFLPQAKGYEILFYLTMYMCLYEWIFPIWYFQGIEKMKYITIINLISRGIFLSLLLFLVKEQSDYLKVPIINIIGTLVSGIISLWIIFKKDNLFFIWRQSSKVLKSYTTKSLPLFYSNFSLMLYRSSNKVVIGYYIGLDYVTYYDIGDKIINFLKIPIRMISQTIFPKINQDYDIFFLKKLKKIVFLITTSIVIIFFIYTPFVVKLLTYQPFYEAVKVTRILLFSVVIVSVMDFFSVFTLLPKGYDKEFGKGMMQTVPIYIVCIGILLLFNVLNIYSVSIVIVLIDAYLLLYFYMLSKKLKLI